METTIVLNKCFLMNQKLIFFVLVDSVIRRWKMERHNDKEHRKQEFCFFSVCVSSDEKNMHINIDSIKHTSVSE